MSPSSRSLPPLAGVGAAAYETGEPAPLRLTVARGALGLELYEPLWLGPLEVSVLSLTWPNLKYPLDLSGGVPLFRSRRGVLEHMRIELDPHVAERFFEPRLGAIVGELLRPPSLWVEPPALGVGLVGTLGALAFELLWAPERGDVRFVVTEARGAGLGSPALGYALRAVDAALGHLGTRAGRIVTIDCLGRRLGRALLPSLGARAPSAERMQLGALVADGDRAVVELDSAFLPAELGDRVVRALELAELTRAADGALAAGDLDAARAGYLAVLEAAPRHPELCALIAEIDLVMGSSEAALGLLAEAVPPTSAGAIGAELLALTDDRDGALEAIRRSAQDERFSPVASLWWQRLAELSTGPERLSALDEAVARCPALPGPRWARFAARVERGDPGASCADALHLEAAAQGSGARHDVCCRAARRLLDAGYAREAGLLFERALRYTPDDVRATVGLARSFLEAGRAERAVGLLERAITLGERSGRVDAEALVELAKLIAEKMRDLPQAIARVRQVGVGSPLLAEARFLEGRWRAALGDAVGAALAWGRLREAIELSHEPDPRAAEWLVEAANFERDVARDVHSCERHLALALRLRPRDERIAQAYRSAAALVLELACRRREKS